MKKWVVRYKEAGESGLEDRSSRPDSSPRPTPAEKEAEIITLRKGEKLTGVHISRKLNIAQKTVSRVCVREKLSRQKDIEPQDDPLMRYEHEAPGDMVHLDINKLRNFKEEGIRNAGIGNRYKSRNKAAGSQYIHVAVDDHSRYATVSVFEDETAESVTQHLIDTYNYSASQGIVIKRVLTDTGSGFKSKKFADACDTLNLIHIFTQPYTPQTNGKVERFIQTLLRERLRRYLQIFRTKKYAP